MFLNEKLNFHKNKEKNFDWNKIGAQYLEEVMDPTSISYWSIVGATVKLSDFASVVKRKMLLYDSTQKSW